jgi:thiamine biosynthesis lipoprotein
MSTVRLARNAMATRFEIVLHGDNPASLRAAGEEALREIELLEAQLSLFRPSSEVAHVNARAAREPVRVTPRVFELLAHAARLTQETAGAFDITVAPLVRCWGFMGGSGGRPSEEEAASAIKRVGMHLVELDRGNLTVRFKCEGVMLDLGAIGKGYAVEKAAEILREAGIASGLLHGGTSTVYAIGHPPECDVWQVSIPIPQCGRRQSEISTKDSGAATFSPLAGMGANERPELLVGLRDEALSVSAVWGKFFREGDKAFGHVIDPRTGQPAAAAEMAAVILESATETDALSTALLTVGPAGHEQIAGLRPGMRTLVVAEKAGELQVASRGICLDESSRPDS